MVLTVLNDISQIIFLTFSNDISLYVTTIDIVFCTSFREGCFSQIGLDQVLYKHILI